MAALSYNFNIEEKGRLSDLFRKEGIADFAAAAAYVSRLAYRRNKDKTDLATVFTEQCGTCSTKHALLQVLAAEQGRSEVKLVLGIFKMKAESTPKIKATLEKHGLAYIPEAHNYLRINGAIADYTWPDAPDFSEDLLAEEEIRAEQITAYKVARHRAFLAGWLQEQEAILYTPDELWHIREQCIRDLAG